MAIRQHGETIADVSRLVGDAVRWPGAVARLRRELPPEMAAAVAELAVGRERATRRFGDADRWWFTRALAEQASHPACAAHRARRFAACASAADLTCGAGVDALAMAAAGTRVFAGDRDPLAVTLCRANASRRAAMVDVAVADALHPPLRDLPAVFLDPARRSGWRRGREQESPTLTEAYALAEGAPGACVKASPALARAEWPAAAEVELVSVGGELKECVLWFGALRSGASRRATVLPADATLTGAPEADGGAGRTPTCPPGRVLYEPDPAVVRAGLVETLAERLGAWKLHPRGALLSADAHLATPFARTYRVLAAVAWSARGGRRVREALAARDAGEVVVKTRGVAVDADALARRLRGRGARRLVVLLAHAPEGVRAYVLEPPAEA